MRRLVRDLGLEDTFGHYIDRLPGATLATDNLVSMFGLNRRLRGALIGHLALFEICSVVPMGRYLAAARRIGGLPALERYYEVHVEADVHHARLALEEMVAKFTAHEPELATDIIFGAAKRPIYSPMKELPFDHRRTDQRPRHHVPFAADREGARRSVRGCRRFPSGGKLMTSISAPANVKAPKAALWSSIDVEWYCFMSGAI